MDQSTLTPIAQGTPVIVRARDAGVHFGLYQGHLGREVTLTSSRRLWYWKCAEGISLSGVATVGIDQKVSKIAAQVERIDILDACEIIPVTERAAASIKDAPDAEAR